MAQQVITSLSLAITPKRLINKHTKQARSSYAFIFKIGDLETESTHLNASIDLTVQALYSNSSKVFHPLKGIVKIFQVDSKGNKIMISVGTLNIQKLPQQQNSTVNLTVNAGQCSLLFQLKVIASSVAIKQSQNYSTKQLRKNLSDKKVSIAPSYNPNKFNKDNRISEYQCIQTPYIVDDSSDQLEKMQQEISISYCSQFSEDFKRDEISYLGEQLVEERRKNRTLQQKYEKCNMKLGIAKKSLQRKKQEIKNYVKNFKKFTNNLQANNAGKYIFEMNQRKHQIVLKYRANCKFKQNFEQYLNFMAIKILQNEKGTDRNDNQIGSNQLIQKSSEQQLDDLQQKHKKLTAQLKKLTLSLKNETNKINQYQQEIDTLSAKIKELEEDNRSLVDMNQYLESKEKQFENIVAIKQNTIEKLKKMIDDNNTDMDVMEEKNTILEEQINNLELRIEESKEQISNLNQVIEEYRKKYGDLKVVKNKAIQMEIKECLRWIDQQESKSQEYIIQGEDDLMALTSDNFGDVSQITKKINHFENMPVQDLSSIRKELVHVLKKLDEVIVNNSK